MQIHPRLGLEIFPIQIWVFNKTMRKAFNIWSTKKGFKWPTFYEEKHGSEIN